MDHTHTHMYIHTITIIRPYLALEDGAEGQPQHLRSDGQGKDERGVGLACYGVKGGWGSIDCIEGLVSA